MITTEDVKLAAERQEKIIRILREQHVVRVDGLSRGLGVSGATIRRDLAEMDRRGQVRRVHGGAVGLDGRLEEPVFDDKAAIAPREKQSIAEAALKFVKPADSIFLDGGSTVLALARLLVNMDQLTAVTNSLRVAGALAGRGPRLIVTGGELRRISQTFVGPLTSPLINQIHVDTAFIGTIGLSIDEGMTTTDPKEAYTKDLAISRAQQVVLLADGSKLGKVSFVKFGILPKVNVLITDAGADRAELQRFKKMGIRVVTA